MPLDGPFYDELAVGETIPALPPITFTDADNVIYRAITGDQHLPSVDRRCFAAMGGSGALVNPGIVMQSAVGQTTGATRRAIANLYYRTVRIHRPVTVGETLWTTTKVLGLADASAKDGLHRGKVWVGIESRTEGGVVMTCERVALLPARGQADPGHASPIPGATGAEPLDTFLGQVPAWDLGGLPRTDWAVGDVVDDAMRDHVDNAPALARMTFNQAVVHRDFTKTANGRRLVYGGHVQALAQASLTRALPGLATVLGWDACDHLGPAFEGELLEFRHRLVEELAVPSGGRLLRVESLGRRVTGDAAVDGAAPDLLRWSAVVLAP